MTRNSWREAWRELNAWAKSRGPTITLLGLVIAVAALALGIVNRFASLEPIGPSPLVRTRAPASRIRCQGESVTESSGRWEIQGQATCGFELLADELVVGAAMSIDTPDISPRCLIFAFGGPSEIHGITLSEAVMTLHGGPADNALQRGLIDSAIGELRNTKPECDDKGIGLIELPKTVEVPGSSEDGVRYDAPFTGEYTIRSVSGAYSSYPVGHPDSLWRTKVNIYLNGPIKWDERLRTHRNDAPDLVYEEPRDPDYSIGNEEIPIKVVAEQAGTTSPPVLLHLEMGDRLIFMPIDDKGWYNNPGPNPGGVVLQIPFTSE